VPYRDEVLRVLRDTPVWVFDDDNKVVGSRKKALMDLRGGRPYRWLYNNIFPTLRNSVAILLYTKRPRPERPHVSTARDSTDTREQTDTTAHTATNGPKVASEGLVEPDPLPATAETDIAGEPWHRLAIKTNLLYDAILMPSLEVEYRFNDHWTINAEADVAWWHNDPKHKYYQVMMLSPECRFWFKHYNNRPWHGFYVGAFGGGGKYDLENGNRGYKGTGYFAGISCGFMFPVSRNISFEAGLGVGYLNTRYEEYIPFEGHYVYQQTSRTQYFGPLKLKFALVWRLWNLKTTGKGADNL